MSNHNNIKRIVMRRVYYTYVLGILTSPKTIHVLGAVALLSIFTMYVSIGDVLYNLSLMKVHQVDTFLYSAIRHTDIWTLIMLVGFVVLGISFMRATRHMQMPRMRAL